MKATTLIRELTTFIKKYGDTEIVFADNSMPDSITARGIRGKLYFSIEKEITP